MTKTNNKHSFRDSSSDTLVAESSSYTVADDSSYKYGRHSVTTKPSDFDTSYKLVSVFDDSERKRIKTRELNNSIGKILR